MNLIEIIAGAALAGWGILYRWLISKGLEIKEDDRPECDGLVLNALTKEDQDYLEIEYSVKDKKYISLAPIYRSEDKNAVGKLVYLRYEEECPEKIEIDWDKEQAAQRTAALTKVKMLMILMCLVGLLLILHGSKIIKL